MPKVTLINYTGIGHDDPLFAARILAYTKNTRLNMTPDGLESFMAKPAEEILAEIAYMATSIPSSWEFADLTFSINSLSRATAQQVTRTRTASFAMQSQRVTDLSEVTWDIPPSAEKYSEDFNEDMQHAIYCYTEALDGGVSKEDARDLLPIGVHCNLIAKYNLRNFVELVRARDSLRVQGPYRDIVQQMKAETLKVWPWAEAFFIPKHKLAISLIEEAAKTLQSTPGAMYQGPAGALAKAADLLKGE